MLKFIQGNPDNLKGKAIVYVKNKCDYNGCNECPVMDSVFKNKGEMYIGGYLSDSPLDLFSFLKKKRDIPEEVLEKIKGDYENKFNRPSSKEVIKLGSTFPVFFNSSEEMTDFKHEDIISLGEFNSHLYKSILNSMSLIQSAFTIYGINYIEQINKKSCFSSSSIEIKTEAELKERLGSLAELLENALNKHDIGKIKEISSEIKSLSRYSSPSEISKFITFMFEYDNVNKKNIIRAEVEKIGAIHSENFEKAQKMQDIVKRLKIV